MDLIETIRSTGAVRGFTDQRISNATIAEILDDARFAPSGGNRQPWRVAVVTDPRIRRSLADIMRPVWHEYVAAGANGATPFAFGHPAEGPPIAAPNDLLDHIETVPAVLVVAADLSRIALMDGQLNRPAMTGGASVFPFCWSVLLAARARQIGGVMTTFIARAEPAAVDLIALPHDHALVATIFLGHPVKQITRLKRKPVDAFATIDRFDGEPLVHAPIERSAGPDS